MKKIPQPQPLSRPHERLKKGIGRKVCLMFTLLSVSLSQVPAQQVFNPTAPTADAKYVDYGESIVADGQVFNLKRISNQVILKTRAGSARFEGDSARILGGKVLGRARSAGDRMAIWTDSTDAASEPKRLQTLLAAANADADIEYAKPVYAVEGSDLRMCGTDELILQLRPDATADALSRVLAEFGLEYARPVAATDTAHVVRLTRPKEYDVLAMVNLLMQDQDVQTARHNFLQEIRFSTLPSDPYLTTEQWHLTYYAAGNADPNANIRADGAWSGSQPYGSPGIVVAVLDNGFQLDHPELSPNLLPGYDFYDGDADPSPSDLDPNDPENHGTALAGMIAAAANGSGSVGGAPNCKILPIRIGEGERFPFFATGDKIKAALVWAADRSDVISCSWELWPPNTDITAGFEYAATSGRKLLDGTAKGTLSFAAAGNSTKWKSFESSYDIPIGNWYFRFYVRNNQSAGGLTTQTRGFVAFVRFPDTDQTIWRFDEPTFPPGWVLETPDYPWTLINDLNNAHGVGRYFIGSYGSLPTSEESRFRTAPMQVTTPGKLRFAYSVLDADGVSTFYVDAFKQNPNGSWPSTPTTSLLVNSGTGFSTIDTSVRYPASILSVVAVGASSDWDYRSDFSCFGSGLDFVAPGGGGYRDIFTTDRTGSAGYNGFSGSADYTHIYGTSLSAPLAAATAALVLSKNGHLTANDLRAVLNGTSAKVHQANGKLAYDQNGWSQHVGYGRLDAYSALAAVSSDTTPPTFTSASVQTTRSIDLVFSEPMGGAIYTPSSYTISGAGKGTLANNPSKVIRLAPEKYRLAWNSGGMVVGSVSVAVSNLKDVAGNSLTGATSKSSTGTKAIELVNGGSSTVLPYGSSDPRTPWISDNTGFWVGNQYIKYNASQVGYTGSTSSSINLSGVTSPAPEAVYQTARMAWYTDGTPSQWLTMNLPGVLPYESCKVRLHFSEMYWSNIGDQRFNIRINNSNPANYPNYWLYDILQQTSGVQNKAAIIEFTVTNGSGPLRIDLEQYPSSGQFPYYHATLNGVEVLRP